MKGTRGAPLASRHTGAIRYSWQSSCSGWTSLIKCLNVAVLSLTVSHFCFPLFCKGEVGEGEREREINDSLRHWSASPSGRVITPWAIKSVPSQTRQTCQREQEGGFQGKKEIKKKGLR